MCPECAAGFHEKCEGTGNGKVCGKPHDMIVGALYEEPEGDLERKQELTTGEEGGSFYAMQKASKLGLGSGGTIGGGIKTLLDSLVGGAA